MKTLAPVAIICLLGLSMSCDRKPAPDFERQEEVEGRSSPGEIEYEPGTGQEEILEPND